MADTHNGPDTNHQTNDALGPNRGVTPHLCVADGRAADAITFYTAAFGAVEMARIPADDGKRLIHAHLVINGASIMLNDDFPEYSGGAYTPPGAITLHLQVDDADSWFNRAVDAGCVITMPIGDQFWGDRYGQLRDPFGFTWSIGSTPGQ
ncbi:MAG: VOC family protein [Sphingopyxis sp.]